MPEPSLRFTVYTAAEKPELLAAINQLSRISFPRFLFEGDRDISQNWDPIMERYPECQFALFEGEEMVGGGVTVPLAWNGSIDDLPDSFERILDTGERETPNVLCATAGLVVDEHQGRGISRDVLLAMRNIALQQGLSSLIVPVRPNHKERYPLVAIEDYIQWRRDDGLLYDPWMRVHERLQAKILKIMPQAAVVRGTIQQWEEWTGMKFLSDGTYVVPGALTPVEIDLAQNEGIHIEPNVWMEHKVRD
ncbi:hypothetical protein [Desmospora activa]|uniref:Acetyltransferase (GNAT) family protein n=1 Tax=Desmospora activa DSM 45169 TaxID=1121389 RepID=A0A2T4Z3Z7_9BACL|nr:hypothetical protein [Desmospora activa]PTM56604.1 hypothetical protein C8J48_2926 [Desmospora activa DSM 45169]